MDRPRSVAARLLMVLLGALAVFAVFAALVPTAAFAKADDPPTITGFTVDEAEKALRTWNPDVDIVYVPSLKELPDGYTIDTVLVAASRQLGSATAPTSVKLPPRVEVLLGSTLPDLTGLDIEKAAASVRQLQLRVNRLPAEAQPDWVVANQRPRAGTVVPFGSILTLVLTAPTPATTQVTVPPSPAIVVERATGSDPLLVGAVAGGATLLLLLAGVFTVSQLRRRGQRNRRPDPPSELIEVRSHPGQVIGPHLVGVAPVVRPGAPPHPADISVRLEPGSKPVDIHIEEVTR